MKVSASASSYDVQAASAERLPPAARARYLAAGDRADSASAFGRTVRERLDALRPEEQRLTATLEGYARAVAAVDWRPLVDLDRPLPAGAEFNSMREMRAQLGRLRRQIAEDQARMDAAGETHQLWRGLQRRCDTWISRQGRIIEASAISLPRIAGAVLDAVELARAQLRNLIAELQAAHRAPLPSSVAKAKMIVEVDALAARGRPRVFGLVEVGTAIEWPKVLHHVPVNNRDVVTNPADDAVALLAWFHRDALVAALSREIEEVADDKSALDDRQRAAKVANLETQILEVERVEAALVEEAGGAILPRSDVDPRAFLGVLGTPPVD